MNKQTALDWLKKQLESYGDPSNLRLDWETLDALIEQAKQMEKEQMQQIYDGLAQNVGTSVSQNDLPSFDEYYNETYGGQDESKG